MEKLALLGAGSWGTALALVLADNNNEVRLWTYKEKVVREINTYHTNSKYLPGVNLPKTITAMSSMKNTIEDIEVIILAIPTKAMRDVLSEMKEFLSVPVTIVHVCKGIEPETHLRVSEVIKSVIPSNLIKDVVVLSGPSHAEEVSVRQPTTVTVASEKLEVAEKVQDLFINNQFRVYTNNDMIGVEIGGSLKNIIALAAGISDGLGFGDNAKAALITRGLAEIARLGKALGANPITFLGLTGMGDLIVTCTSIHSRNWRAGNRIGKGDKLDAILEEMGMAVEGIRTTKAVYQLAKKLEIEMPITNALYQIIFQKVDPKTVVERLMKRSKSTEIS
ncbi:glycerol-3-phosphate dehydrogenase [Bacillus sp. LL01]|uniref:NAD(P)H-dependent glycerol-3-phosphate dehydrogenase n=1 Tax=Bacillus sp. LL01 TaxID=1665556 RepID=UPI00064D537E|nr:NAD(P)H-dependent glycerol-3-phosphate dehydrogenase [Bacillus sp. LL01]KMJ59033.1 glycerol-3-phosphate dehydrogenase [Bacillus sp. LL01]